MAKTKTVSTAFNAGELSPKIYGRVDLEQYYNGCKSLKNAIIYPQGGAAKRYGLEGLSNLSHNDGYPETYSNSRIEAFTFNNIEKYVVVFKGNGTILIYEVGETITVVGIINGTDYTDSKLDSLNVIQSQDSMLITHYDVSPKQLIRNRLGSTTVWELKDLPLRRIPSFSYGVSNTDQWKKWSLSYSGFSNGDEYTLQVGSTFKVLTYNLTYSGSGNRNEDASLMVTELQTKLGAGFTVAAEYIARTVDTSSGGTTSYQTLDKITVSSTTNTTTSSFQTPSRTKKVFVIPTGGNTNIAIPEPVWSATRGWPATCALHHGRLWFGGSKSRPQTLWASRSGSYFDFGVEDPSRLLANDALDLTLNDTTSNLVTSMVSQKDLLVFTNGGIFRIGGENNLITPINVFATKDSEFGSKFAQPVQMDNATFYLQNEGAQLNSLNYDFSRDGYLTNPQALLSDHLLINPKSLAKISAGDDYNSNYMFVLNEDGTCALFNRLENQNTSTWTPFTTDGIIKSICGVYNEMYCLVERKVVSGGVESVALILERYYENSNFADSWIKYSFGTPTLTIPSTPETPHYANKTVAILSDGYAIEVDVPDDGLITLPFAATEVMIGLPLEFEIETMPYAANLQSGNSRFSRKRVFRVLIDMLESLGFNVEYAGQTYKVADRKMGFRLKEPPIPMQGLKEVRLRGFNADGNIKITSKEPLPVHLRSLQLEVKVTG